MMTTSGRALALALLTCSIATTGSAQNAVPIRDNSFLIEEAYNQEWGVVQHVFTFQRMRGVRGWEATFTQEWPAPAERHQLSYTVPMQRSAAGATMETGVGDIALNYRHQLRMPEGSAAAVSPRLSLLLPTGDERQGRGAGGVGVEVNLPLSVELSPWLVSHSNLGGAWTPSARNAADDEASAGSVFAGQSLIWLAHPKLSLMLEALWTHDQSVVGGDATEWERGFVVAPGARAAIDFPSGLQIVPGIAFPLGIGPSDGERGIYLYLSLEHPFRRR